MNKMIFLIMGICIIIIPLTQAFDITQCTTITERGTYYLTQNLFNDDEEYSCIEIQSDYVTINGNGYGIYNDWNDACVYVENQKNINVKGLKCYETYTGVEAVNSKYLDISNNYFDYPDFSAFEFYSVDGFNIVNNQVIGSDSTNAVDLTNSKNGAIQSNRLENSGYNFYFSGNLSNIRIYNNYVKSYYQDLFVSRGSRLSYFKWNIPKILGKNIVGGKYIAGNYWANRVSLRCADFNSDGLCDDEIQVLGYNQYDKMPLAGGGLKLR